MKNQLFPNQWSHQKNKKYHYHLLYQSWKMNPKQMIQTQLVYVSACQEVANVLKDYSIKMTKLKIFMTLLTICNKQINVNLMAKKVLQIVIKFYKICLRRYLMIKKLLWNRLACRKVEFYSLNLLHNEHYFYKYLTNFQF